MAVSYRATGAGVTAANVGAVTSWTPGTNSATTVSGDLALHAFGYRWSSGTPTITGWTAGWEYLGTIQFSTNRAIAVFAKIVTGTSFTCPAITFSSAIAAGTSGAIIFSVAGDKTYEVVMTSGEDTTNGSSYSAPALANPGIDTGDRIATITCLNTGTASAPTAYALAATGATFTSTYRTFATNGAQPYVYFGDHACTAGPASAAPTHSFTHGSSDGPTVFIRVREKDRTFIPTPDNAPVVTLVSPPEGAIATTDDIVVDVTDPDGDLASVYPIFHLVTADIYEPAFNPVSDAFIGAYLAASSKTPITNGFRFTFDRGGWVDASLALQVSAMDDAGNETVEDFAWTTSFSGSYACGVIPLNAPAVTVESPLPYDDPGSPMDPTAPIIFTITDDDAEPGLGGGLERALPVIMFPDGTDALVHDGDNFRPRFYGSTRAAITGGYRYTVYWFTGRWPQPPTLMPYAYDLTGREAP